jgi:hypothetical protein
MVPLLPAIPHNDDQQDISSPKEDNFPFSSLSPLLYMLCSGRECRLYLPVHQQARRQCQITFLVVFWQVQVQPDGEQQAVLEDVLLAWNSRWPPRSPPRLFTHSDCIAQRPSPPPPAAPSPSPSPLFPSPPPLSTTRPCSRKLTELAQQDMILQPEERDKRCPLPCGCCPAQALIHS